jgi:aryl sulfotransferase
MRVMKESTEDRPLVKRREILNRYLDSRPWNDFAFREGDVVIATYAKSGTTWMQQIVSQLVFNGAEDLDLHQLSPWIDLRTLPQEARDAVVVQTHRRFVKSHLPSDALVLSPLARYIYICRDGRDAAWSFHNHHYNMTDEVFARYNSGLPHDVPLIVRGTDDPYEFYRAWFTGNGHPIWPFWEHVRSWWNIRNQPNVMLIHFNDLKADLDGSIRRVARFLDISPDRQSFEVIKWHCTFEYMKAHAAGIAPRGGAAWKGGADTFIHKGTNGRWRDWLTAEDVAAYEQRAVSELGAECARWVSDGGQYSI